MDYIEIKELTVFAHHGVYSEEKYLGQKFVISCKLYLDTYKAAHSRSLEDSVHYGEVCDLIHSEFGRESFDLIETAAEEIAAKILFAYPMLKGIELTLAKPWAPVHLPLERIQVVIHRCWTRCFVGLGSNVGDNEANLDQAMKLLGEVPMIRDLKESDRLITDPWGVEDQAVFLNSVASFETTLSPHQLLKKLLGIEDAMGRVREQHWGPRNIDLDLLFYGDKIIYTEDLIVPHPYICDREFVLIPMAEIAPYWNHPVRGRNTRELLIELNLSK
ncbi:MAG: 2-amino-4-hydroxy-6-hydroxymethyldihydropteridine diphosphokinase [Tissierellia bacterium]|nr:2-amino-4-hydroxy-6-hydroxymethyldihydropteridine diphosphokinase [Tissierellia bacterium]